MTFATVPRAQPAPVVLTRATTIPLPAPLRGDHPTLSRRCTHDDPHLVVIAREDCRACGGEGSIEYDVPRGVWVPAQGGMWVPNSRWEECEECDGLGYHTRARCVACGRLHGDVDEWGVTTTDDACDCDPEPVAAAIERLDEIERIAALVARTCTRVQHAGFSVQDGLHGVPWNLLLALAARHQLEVHRYARELTGTAFTTVEMPFVIDGEDERVTLYALTPEGV